MQSILITAITFLLFAVNVQGQCWQKIFAGRLHIVAIKNDSILWSWGENTNGQIGNGNYTNQNTPVRIGTGDDWIQAAAGLYFTAAVKGNGSLPGNTQQVQVNALFVTYGY